MGDDPSPGTKEAATGTPPVAAAHHHPMDHTPSSVLGPSAAGAAAGSVASSATPAGAAPTHAAWECPQGETSPAPVVDPALDAAALSLPIVV